MRAKKMTELAKIASMRAALRADAPWPPPKADYQLRKGLEHCPACGKVVSKTRKRPHPETGECLVRKTIFDYEQRGWRPVGVTYAGILGDVGAPLERAPSSLDPFAKDLPEQVTIGWYAPNSAIAACEVLANMRLGVTLRRAAIASLIERPELIEAIDTVKRTGADPRAFVREVAWEKYQEMEAANEGAGSD